MKLFFTLFISCFGIISILSCQTKPSLADANLKSLVNNDSTLLVDVRTPEEYNEGHVKGSINIPVNTIEYNLSKLEGKKNIVVFCRSGKRAENAKGLLEAKGFENVTNALTWKAVEALVEPKEEMKEAKSE